MKEFFLILGLPRSRTAWLSTLFTAGDVFCWHDLGAEYKTPGDIVFRMQTTPGVVGLADPAAAMILPYLLEELHPRIAVINHDFEDSLASMAFACGLAKSVCRAGMEMMMQAVEAARAMDHTLTVELSHLDEEPTLRKLWDHLVPGHAFPGLNLERINNMQIQVKPCLMRAAAAKALLT